MLVRGLIRGLLARLKRGLGASIWRVAIALAGGASASTTDGTSFAIAASTLKANTLYLLAIACSHTGTAETPNAITGGAFTWTAVTNSAVSTTGLGRRVAWFYTYAAAGGAGPTGYTFATSHTGSAYLLVEVPGGILEAPTEVVTATANSTTITGTLTGIGSSNIAIYALLRTPQENSVVPTEGGWQELCDHPTTSWATPSGGLQVAWAVGDPTANPTWATSGQAAISILELRTKG